MRSAIGDQIQKPNNSFILTHFSISVLGRKGRFYTRERSVREESQNAMSIAELQSSRLSNCDASFSSHQSNVLSHQGLLMVQSIDTKSLLKPKSSVVDRLAVNNRYRALIDSILSQATPRWVKLKKIAMLFV